MQTGAGGAGAGGMSGKQFPQRTPVDMALHTLSHGGDGSSSPSAAGAQIRALREDEME